MPEDRGSTDARTHERGRVDREFARGRLGDRLRHAREDNTNLSVKQAAKDILGLSEATLSKIENGKQAVKIAYVKLLVQEYGLPQEERDDIIAQAEEANGPGPFVRYLDVAPRDFQDYHEIEQKARKISVHKVSLVFGPLQVPGYVRGLRLAVKPDSTEEDLTRSVELRQLRFRQLTREGGPQVKVIFDEGALLRPVGGREVQREQILHLKNLAEEHVDEDENDRRLTIQVVPLTAGAYVAQEAGFTLAQDVPPEPTEDYVYLENDKVAIYLDERSKVARYVEMYEQLEQKAALSPHATIALLDRMAKNL